MDNEQKLIGLAIYNKIMEDMADFNAKEQFTKSLNFFKAVQDYSNICYSSYTLYDTINNISLEEILLNVYYEFEAELEYSFYYYFNETNEGWSNIVKGCCWSLKNNIDNMYKIKYPLAEMEKIKELLQEGLIKAREDIYSFCINWYEMNLNITTTMQEKILEGIE